MTLLAAITPQPVLGKERHINKSVKKGELLSRPLCSHPAATPIDHSEPDKWRATSAACLHSPSTFRNQFHKLVIEPGARLQCLQQDPTSPESVLFLMLGFHMTFFLTKAEKANDKKEKFLRTLFWLNFHFWYVSLAKLTFLNHPPHTHVINYKTWEFKSFLPFFCFLFPC